MSIMNVILRMTDNYSLNFSLRHFVSSLLLFVLVIHPFYGQNRMGASDIEKHIEMLIQQAVYRSSHQRCSIKNGVLKNFAKLAGKHLCKSLFFNEVAGREHLCQSLIFNKVATLKAATLLKNTLAQVFSCDF